MPRWATWAIVAVVVLLIAGPRIWPASQAAKLSYTEFLDRVKENQVSSIEINNLSNVISGKLKGGGEFTTTGAVALSASDETLLKEVINTNIRFRFAHFKQVTIDRPRDTVKLKNPKHLRRSYFNRSRLTEQEKTAIANFFKNNINTIRLSPCLRDWLGQPFKWTEPYYFVDHNDDAWMVMLSLIRPGLIKKTFSIIKA